MSLLLLLKAASGQGCRLLICARDMGGTGAGQWRKGDVAVVMPADHKWGRLEGLPDFIQVDLVDVDEKGLGAWTAEVLDRNGELAARRAQAMKATDVDAVRTNLAGRLATTKADLETRTETKPSPVS